MASTLQKATCAERGRMFVMLPLRERGSDELAIFSTLMKRYQTNTQRDTHYIRSHASDRDDTQRLDIPTNNFSSPKSTHLTLKSSRRRNQNHNQTAQYQRPRNQTHKHNTPPTRRELPPNHIMLCLKVSVEPNEQHDDSDADERCAEGLAEVAEVVFGGH